MSEPIPESIPTSTSRISRRPNKKQRSHNPGLSAQSHSLAVLFANADREVTIPTPSTTKAAPAPPPEIVANVQGSSAGAGSGEFHVYKASRRREYERLKAMDEEVQQEEYKKEWARKREEEEKKEEKRMGKNKARRDKAKERKKMKENGKRRLSEEGDQQEGQKPVPKKGLGARKDIPIGDGADLDGEEDSAMPVVEDAGLTIHDDEED